MKEQWDQRYAEEAYQYGETPNDFFKQEIDNLTAGAILLPADGEGRNSVYAATQGWNVSAFDYSEEAKKKADALAQKNGVTVDFQTASAEDYTPAKRFDAIALIFAHFPPPVRKALFARIASMLNPGGILIIEGYATKQLENKTGGPPVAELLYEPEILHSELAGMKAISVEPVHRTIHEGLLHNGVSDTIQALFKKI